MKKKTQLIFTLLVIFIKVNFVYGQFPGKKIKDDFLAIDGTTFKIGDVITFGQPMNGDQYASIITYERKTLLDNVSDVSGAMSGQDVKSSEFGLGSKELRKKTDAKILYFKAFKDNEGVENHFAIVPNTPEIYLAIPINTSLQIGEIISKNPNYKPWIDEANDKENTLIKSFSSDFEVKLLSVTGHKIDQTVEIEFLLKHSTVHKEVCFNIRSADAKLYDFEGNEYLIKSASVGSLTESSDFSNSVCNKVPTNVPVKAKIVFKKILSDHNKMSFGTIKVGYKDSDGGNYEYGTLEMTNINVDWK